MGKTTNKFYSKARERGWFSTTTVSTRPAGKPSWPDLDCVFEFREFEIRGEDVDVDDPLAG